MAFGTTTAATFDIIARDKAVEVLDKVDGRLLKSLTVVNKFGAAVGLAGGVSGVGLLVSNTLKSVDALAKQADLLDTSTEFMATLNRQADLYGTTQESVNNALKDLRIRVSEAADGTGEASTALRELGIDAKLLEQLPLEDQFRAITEAMGGVENASDRVRIANKLMGEQGVQVLNIINAGTESFDAARAEVDRYGTAISSIRADEIEAANDAIATAGEAVKGLGIQLTAALAPAISEVALQFANWVSFITNQAVPALRLMAENVLNLDANVRSLSETEIEVRLVAWRDRVAEINAEIDRYREGLSQREGAPIIEAFTEELDKVNAQIDEAEARLAQLRAGSAKNNDADTDVSSDEGRVTFEEQQEMARAKREAEAEKKRAEREAEAQRKREEREAIAAQKRLQREAIAQQRELDQLFEAEQRKFQLVEESLKTREEVENEAFARRMQIIQQNAEVGLITEQRAHELLEREARRHELAMLRIADESQKSRLSGTVAHWSQITSSVATGSKKIFQLNKLLAISQALLDLPATVSSAYRWGMAHGGPAVAVATAGLAGAAQIGRINQIRSTSFGSGTTPSSAGTTPTINGNPVPQTGPSGSATESGATVALFDALVRGLEPDGLYSGAQLQQLLNGFSEIISDGGAQPFLESVTAQLSAEAA